MKMKSIPERGRKGSVIYSETRHGNVAREYVPPHNPRTPQQQAHRRNHRAVVGRWGTLTDEQQAAWRVAAANKWFLNDEGLQVRLNGYNFFTSINVRRADLNLPQFDFPPAEPVFEKNPIDELAASLAGGVFTLKLRIPSAPAQYTLVYGAAPVRSGVRSVQHFYFLGLLPPSKDGWSDITRQYVARFGAPKPDWAIWIRTCQHIDGWQDAPTTLHARISVQAA
jgi:hypothetical protein